MSRIPKAQQWLFWNVDLRKLDLTQDADGIIARIVERGGLVDIKWLIRTYGLEDAALGFAKRFGRADSDLYHVLMSLAYFDDAERDLRPAGLSHKSSLDAECRRTR